jgi:hypothetical protein
VPIACPEPVEGSRRRCETLESHFAVAILVSLAMCLLVVRAHARQQSSPGQSAAAASTDHASTGTAAPKKTTGTASHHRSSKSTHQTSAKTTRTTSAGHHSARHSRKSKIKRVRGQQKIDSERATSIQQALIREHYLNGEPSGVWDESSEAAMRRYQSDQGWQTKEVPDSRALIKLGLGPSNDHLLNPDSAMTSTPIARRAEAPASAHSSSQPANNSGDSQPVTKPASVPETAPAAQPVPATPPKDSDNSPNPQ